MPQGNQKNKVQFCRELGPIVDEILNNSKELLSIFQKLSDLYKPKSQEEANEFYRLRFGLPNSVRMLCELQKLNVPDNDELYEAVAPLRDMAIEVATRMVSAEVIFNDIITMYIEPHDDDMYIHLYFTMLKLLSNSIWHMRGELDKLHTETSQLWPDLVALDDDTQEEEETILPGEIESFHLMRSSLVEALEEYAKEHDSERISGFILAVQDYLEDFANGIEPDKEFEFGLVWKTGNDEHHGIEYMDYHFESGMLPVISGGSIYDKSVGSERYTNWDYSIGLDGEEEDNYDYCFSTVLELVRNDAKLSIENPDEYTNDLEDE